MKYIRLSTFLVVFGGFILFVPQTFAAESSRYLIKSDAQFLKTMLGSRHEFKNGFTADVSDLQFRLIKLLGVEVEPVRSLQILPAEVSQKTTPVKARKPIARPVPEDQTPWGIEIVYNDPKISSTTGGDGVKVAVIDTGVNTDHSDLKNRIFGCKDFTGRVAVIDGKCLDRNGHGTHVAGIVLADAGSDQKGIYGVAPSAQLLAFKACRDNGSCSSDDIATAIYTATNDGAQIINMSFGSDTDISLIRDAVEYAATKGVLLVAAAGNDGPFPDSIDYPAAYSQVVAVGAVARDIIVTDWSSRGINALTDPNVINDRDIELVAPGENILSTSKDGGYISLSGTSMASPFIAGLAAKYWQADAENPAETVRAFLRSLAQDIVPLGEDNTSGFGLPRVK